MKIIILNILTGSVDILMLSKEQEAQCDKMEVDVYLESLGYPTSHCQWMCCHDITSINIYGPEEIHPEETEQS